MWSSDLETEWLEVTAGGAKEFRAWREAQPRADLTAMEAALDEPWLAVRARLLEDAIHASPAADRRASPERPPCPGAAGSCPPRGGSRGGW